MAHDIRISMEFFPSIDSRRNRGTGNRGGFRQSPWAR